jgi:hypothetical protein
MRPTGLRSRRGLEMGKRNGIRSHHRLARLGRVLARHRRFSHGPVALARRLVGSVAIVDHYCTRGLRPGCRLESHSGLRTSRAGFTCPTAATAPTAASATTSATAALGAFTLRFACDPGRGLARRARQGFRARYCLVAWLDLASRGGAALGATLRAAIAITPALVAAAVTATVPTAIAVVAIAVPTVAAAVTAITPGAICIT